MNYSTFYKSIVRRIYVEVGVERSEAVARVTARLPDVPVTCVDSPAGIPPEHRSGTTLYLSSRKGRPVTRCPGTRVHRCCNYLTVDLYSGCPIGCTYCIMRSYLNFSPITVTVDTASVVEELARISATNPGRMIRVGTGETGDSLLYDPLFELSRPLVEGVGSLPNVYFEMKTKTDHVEQLLDIDPKGNAVVGFSVAPPAVIEAEEGSGATLPARLDAAARAADSGYLVSFHFDPMFYSEGWRELYLPVVDAIVDLVRLRPRHRRVAWVSLGTFRYPPELKDLVGNRPYLYDELVRSADGKYRTLQRLRREMYRTVRDALLSRISVPVYLCMESEAVWRRAFGALPEEIAAVAPLFEPPVLD
jgi:spore photoproduct lyase